MVMSMDECSFASNMRSHRTLTASEFIICAGNDIIVVASNVARDDCNCYVMVVKSSQEIVHVPIGTGMYKDDLISSLMHIAGRFVMQLSPGRVLTSADGIKWVASRDMSTFQGSGSVQTVNGMCFRVQSTYLEHKIETSICGLHWERRSGIEKRDSKDSLPETISWNGNRYIIHDQHLHEHSTVYTASSEMLVWKSVNVKKLLSTAMVIPKMGGACVAFGDDNRQLMFTHDRVYTYRKLRFSEVTDVSDPQLFRMTSWCYMRYCDAMKEFVAVGINGMKVVIATTETIDGHDALRVRTTDGTCRTIQSMQCTSKMIAIVTTSGHNVSVIDIDTGKCIMYLPQYGSIRNKANRIDGKVIADGEIIADYTDADDGNDVDEVGNDDPIDRDGGHVYDRRCLIISVVISVIIGMLICSIVDGNIEVIIDVVLKMLMIRPS